MQRGPREFSWFIFRVTNPTMREFFMDPQNPLRVKEALISLLAGDIYGKTPIWRVDLSLLKALYYLVSLGNLAPHLPGLAAAPASTSAMSRSRPREGAPRGGAAGCWSAASAGGACAADEAPLPAARRRRRAPRAPSSRCGSSASASRRCASPTTAAPTSRSTYAAAAAVLRLPRRFLRADRDGARALLQRRSRRRRRQRRRLGADAQPATTRARAGMPDLPGTFEIGPNVNVALLRVRRPRREARPAPAAARRDHARALAATSIGVTFSPNLNLDLRGSPAAGTSACSPARCSPTAATTSTSTASTPEFATAAAAGLRGARRLRRLARASARVSRRFGNALARRLRPLRQPARRGRSTTARWCAASTTRHGRLRHLVGLRDLEPARHDRRLSGDASQPLERPRPARLLYAAAACSSALMSLLWNLVALLLYPLLPRARRHGASAAPAIVVRATASSGPAPSGSACCSIDSPRSTLLRDEPGGLIIAANHPSMLDALLRHRAPAARRLHHEGRADAQPLPRRPARASRATSATTRRAA